MAAITKSAAEASTGLAPKIVVSELVERLVREAGDQLPRRVVAEIVGQCLLDLQPVSAAALPELLERLARQRVEYSRDEPSLWLD